MKKNRSIVSAELERLSRQIEHWRRNKSTKKMPDHLWSKAVCQAKELGICMVALKLRLNFTRLRKRMEVSKERSCSLDSRQDASRFVEVRLPTSVHKASMEIGRGIQIQFIAPGGGMIHIDFKGEENVNWDSLFSAWLRVQSKPDESRDS